MGQLRKPGSRTATVMTKLRPGEKAVLRENAERLGVGMSTLVRMILLANKLGQGLAGKR